MGYRCGEKHFAIRNPLLGFLILILVEETVMAGDRYGVCTEQIDGYEVFVLVDSATGQEARVLPSAGNNCFSYTIGNQGASLELFWTPPDPGALIGRPSGFGIPILFPWPNRVDRGHFTFEGKNYELDTPGPGEHASHGFVHARPWRFLDSGASVADGAWVQSRFKSENFAEIARQFPFPFEAKVTHRLKNGALQVEFEGKNTGSGPMPAGLGFHPYFKLPLTPEGSRDICTVQMPASTYWPLRSDPIPTGEIWPVEGTVFDVRHARPMKGLFFDHVWSGVTTKGGWSRCEYADPTAGIRIAMEAGDVFRELVLYAPDSRPVVCFEPYTCVTNAFNLQYQGIDAGLMRLGPGEVLAGVMRIVGQAYTP